MESRERDLGSPEPTGPMQPIPSTRPGRLRDPAALVVLAIVSLGLGCLINFLRPRPLPWRYQGRAEVLATAVTRLTAAQPAPAAAEDPADPTHETRLDEFEPFVAGHRGPILDARPAVFFREGHVPGALSLPRETFEEEYPRLRARLEPYKDQQIVVYCSGGDCPDSQLVADALTKLGYRRLVIYTSGWDEWSQTGLPQEGSPSAP